MANNQNNRRGGRMGIVETIRRPGQAPAADAASAPAQAAPLPIEQVKHSASSTVAAAVPTFDYKATSVSAQSALKLLRDHARLSENMRTANPKAEKEAATCALQATKLIIAQRDEESFQLLWDWHVNNVNGSMSDIRAFYGASATYDHRDFTLYSVVWAAFRHLVLKDGVAFDMNRLLKETKCQALVTFLTIKKR